MNTCHSSIKSSLIQKHASRTWPSLGHMLYSFWVNHFTVSTCAWFFQCLFARLLFFSYAVLRFYEILTFTRRWGKYWPCRFKECSHSGVFALEPFSCKRETFIEEICNNLCYRVLTLYHVLLGGPHVLTSFLRNPVRCGLLFHPFCSWGSWSTGRLNNWAQLTYLLHSRVGTNPRQCRSHALKHYPMPV